MLILTINSLNDWFSGWSFDFAVLKCQYLLNVISKQKCEHVKHLKVFFLLSSWLVCASLWLFSWLIHQFLSCFEFSVVIFKHLWTSYFCNLPLCLINNVSVVVYCYSVTTLYPFVVIFLYVSVTSMCLYPSSVHVEPCACHQEATFHNPSTSTTPVCF